MSQSIFISSVIIVISLIIAMFFYTYQTATSEVVTLNLALSSNEFMEQLKNHTNAVLIDIRTLEEFDNGHIASAVNIDYYDKDFIETILAAATNKTLFIYCRSGNRTTHAAYILQQSGITVYELENGITGYSGKLAQ